MAHFAELDENDIVLRVVVVNNSDLMDADGNESEQIGVQYLNSVLGSDNTWVQTSYNATFRGVYAGIGFSYDRVRDVFVPPEGVYVD